MHFGMIPKLLEFQYRLFGLINYELLSSSIDTKDCRDELYISELLDEICQLSAIGLAPLTSVIIFCLFLLLVPLQLKACELLVGVLIFGFCDYMLFLRTY